MKIISLIYIEILFSHNEEDWDQLTYKPALSVVDVLTVDCLLLMGPTYQLNLVSLSTTPRPLEQLSYAGILLLNCHFPLYWLGAVVPGVFLRIYCCCLIWEKFVWFPPNKLQETYSLITQMLIKVNKENAATDYFQRKNQKRESMHFIGASWFKLNCSTAVNTLLTTWVGSQRAQVDSSRLTQLPILLRLARSTQLTWEGGTMCTLHI